MLGMYMGQVEPHDTGFVVVGQVKPRNSGFIAVVKSHPVTLGLYVCQVKPCDAVASAALSYC